MYPNYNTEEQQFPAEVIIAELGKVITYSPMVNRVIGSVTATILLQQIVFWAEKRDWGAFYKFRAPCNHAKYKRGDSWSEELAFSPKEFDTALKRIGTKITKGISKASALAGTDLNSLVIYWTDKERITWYQLNVPLLRHLFGQFFSNLPTEIFPGNLPNGNYLKHSTNGNYISSTENTNINYNQSEGENLESSDQTKILPDLPVPSNPFAVSSSQNSFKRAVDNNSQQVAKESEKEKKPSLTEMMEAIPIKNKFPKRKIAEILINEGCGIEDIEAVMDWVWNEIGSTPHYQGKQKQIGLNLYFKDICNQRTYTDIDGNQSTGNGVSKQTVLELACEAVKGKKSPTETINTSSATNTSHANLTHDRKIAIKQINLALQKGDRSLAQSIAAKYGLNCC